MPETLPQPTLKNIASDVLCGIKALFTDPFANRIVIPIIIACVSIFSKLVIHFVAYTEIDFKTYMQQIELVNDGALDYSLIEGDTGPIVYPAGFVQIYQLIYSWTDEGTNIGLAQALFSYLLTASVVLACVVYSMVQGLPPWPLYLLILSKRIYSIYVLRLFNDCFATIAMIGVTVLLQQASYWLATMGLLMTFLLTAVAADLFSLAISVKMNALLYLPGFVIVSYFLVGENLLQLLVVLLVIPAVQLLVGWRFLLPFFDDEEASYLRWTYIKQAFNFERVFLYEWTVNWRFFSEKAFLSPYFAKGLLVGHAAVLLFFIFTRFLHPKVTGKLVTSLFKDAVLRPFSSTISPTNVFLDSGNGPKLVLLVLSSTNVIGTLFARSLHYQFLSWYCWQLPFLLYATGANPVVGFALFVIHEWCWNVFPSTKSSSLVLIVLLVGTLAAVWKNSKIWFGEEQDLKEKKEQ